MISRPTFLRALVPCLILAAGCATSSDNAIQASLDTDFQLGLGQSALIAGANLEIGFVDVISDSRCPKGEQCFSAGDAAVRIWLQESGENRHEEVLHTPKQGPRFADFSNHRIHLVDLTPDPVSGVTTPPADYRVVLRVEVVSAP